MTDNDQVRDNLETPPHDLQAERAVLGSLLKNPRAVYQVIDVLVPEAFYDIKNRLVFTAALSLVHQEIAIDYHTLDTELQRQGT
jgi:replicative DNA helicase